MRVFPLLCTLLLFARPSIADYPGNMALEFDGVDDFILFPHMFTDYDLSTSWTLEAWIQASPSMGTSTRLNVVGFPSRSPVLEVCGVAGTCKSGAVVSQLKSSTGQVFAVGDSLEPSVADSQWHHIAATWNNQTLVLYVDGVAVDSTTPYTQGFKSPYVCEEGVDCLRGMQIGGFFFASTSDQAGIHNTQYFAGVIDEVRVWQTARSAEQIASSMSTVISPTEAGLLYYWRFDEGTSSVVASSASLNYGDLGGGSTTAMPSWVASTAPVTWPSNEKCATILENQAVGCAMSYDDNFALTFDGTNDVVTFLHMDTDLQVEDGTWTVEAWLKPATSQSEAIINILTFPSRAPSLLLCGDGTNTGCTAGTIMAKVYDLTGKAFTASSSAVVNNGIWHHVAGTWDGTTLTVYVDGAASGSIKPADDGFTAQLQCTPTFCIAGLQLGGVSVAGGNTDRYYAGVMDEVRVWTSARTAAEITEKMHLTLMGNNAGLLYYFMFDEPGSPVVRSNTPSPNYGVLGGGSVVARPQWVLSDAPVVLSGAPYRPGYTPPNTTGATIEYTLIVTFFVEIAIGVILFFVIRWWRNRMTQPAATRRESLLPLEEAEEEQANL